MGDERPVDPDGGSTTGGDEPVVERWPRTVEQAVDMILERLPREDRERVKGTPREDLIMFHHGWGTGIRNEFGLWRGNDALLADCGGGHPDDCSMVIIEAAWERLQRE